MKSTSPITSDFEEKDLEDQPVYHTEEEDVPIADELDLSHVLEKYREKLRSMLHELRSM